MVPVLNKRKHVIPKGAVYIGRPSIFGNPFVIGKEGDRDEVIRKFKEYFDKRLNEDPKFRMSVHKLLDAKALVCWCAPKKCHGDIIAAYLKSL